MIPKIIHYCWFGRNPLPPLALECIASWKKYLPDYEIKEWNEDNFDVNIIPYTAEAYKQKKYAFVSDYARFWIMYKYGGIYFDTDVEVIRPMDDIIEKGNFMGFELDPDGENTPGKYAPRYAFSVALGLGFGMEKEHPFMKKMLDYYAELAFETPHMDPWFKTIVAYTTELLCTVGLENKQGIQILDFPQANQTLPLSRGSRRGYIYIYPSEYFAPINVISGRLHITPNTRTIHRYMGSWTTKKAKSFKDRIRNFLPEWVFFVNNKIKRRKYKY